MKGISILALAATLMVTPCLASAQAPAPEGIRVSVKAKGDDVRTVLASIFEQAKKDYVLPVNFRFALFLSMEDQPFEKALDIVCKQTGLVATLEEGIYQVRVAPKPKPVPVEPVAPAVEKVEKVEKPVVPAKVTLPTSVLAKRLTTRLAKTDLREVIAAISEQVEVPIEVQSEVPAYKIDAFLIKTSLKFALDNITKAAKLGYRFTNRGTIEIFTLSEHPLQ